LTEKFLESKVFTLGSSRLVDYGERNWSNSRLRRTLL